MFSDCPILSVITFLPALAAICLFVIPTFSPKADDKGTSCRNFSLFISLLVFALSLMLLVDFNSTSATLQFIEDRNWIKAFGIRYQLGIDGISIFLVLLTTFIMPLVILASVSIKKHIRGYLASMLLLQTAMLGTLMATDVFLFYVFWELMLAPMYFIIGIWGGERKIYATVKFVLYTVVGSLLMLVAIFYVVWMHFEQSGDLTFVLSTLVRDTYLSMNEELWLFGAFALAFGIKIPLFPFHTWLPDAHVEAPTGGSVVLAGVLLKMGLYGFIRFAYPLFPRGAEYFAPILALLAVIGIIYGAFLAWAQKDIKKLVAYSSVSHLGYCVLGFVAFNVVSATGSIYQMLNHGISTGALFLLVGVLYDRRHTRLISEYGGLASKVPVFAFLFMIFTLSSIALPLTNGFIGEFLILSGSYKTFPYFTVLALFGVVFGAVYMLTLYLKTMFGELDESKNGKLTDVNSRELITFLPMLVLVFVMGVFPQPFISRIEPTVKAYISEVSELGRSRERRELAEFFQASIKNELSQKTTVALDDSFKIVNDQGEV